MKGHDGPGLGPIPTPLEVMGGVEERRNSRLAEERLRQSLLDKYFIHHSVHKSHQLIRPNYTVEKIFCVPQLETDIATKLSESFWASVGH